MSSEKSLRDRRLLRPVPVTERNPDNEFVLPVDMKREGSKSTPSMHVRHKLLLWINEHTVGDFYIGAQLLYFVEDIDAMTYTLFDLQSKIDNGEF